MKNIFVIGEGVDDTFYKRDLKEIIEVTNKYKVHDSDYFIFVGTVHPRKNLPNTIKAFSEALKSLDNKNLKLVISGKLGWEYAESLDAPKKFNVEENVLYVGRVPDQDLPALISGAKGLINFSLEEGFGLPLLEAMACETQCVVSDIPPFKEVCGELATYADPKNVTDMKNAIISAYKKNEPEMIKLAKERTSRFSWDESAKKILTIFQSVAKNL